MKKYQNRKEVPQKYKWQLTDFFKSDEDWEFEYNRLSTKLKELEKFKTKINDGNELEKFLLLDTEISNDLDDLFVYSYLSHDVDLENPIYIEMKNKATSLYNKYNIAISFFVPELLQIDNKCFQKLFEQNPNLKKFQRVLEDIYEKKEHTLNENEEKIIATLTETYSSYSDISSSLIDSEHDYGKIKLQNDEIVTIASNNLRLLKRNKDERIRKKASKQFNKTISQYQTTAAALLNNYIKNNINLATIRNYENPWKQKLENNHLVPEIFTSLQKVAEKNNSINKKYYSLMKEVLDTPVLHSYDTIMDWSKSDKDYTIEEAEELVLNSLRILGEKYQEKATKVFDRHYIDYCQYKGKTNGGYSYAAAKQDSRILLSFNGKISNIFTIIHELGHNVHHQYVNENNPVWYRHCTSFVAEIASLTNEILLSDYLYKNGKTKEEKLTGLENFIKTFQNNFFGAVMEGQLELKMYEHVQNGNSLTSTFLNEECMNLQKYYRGNTIKTDEYSKLMWVTRSHYYMNFYLFNYAVCMSVATSNAQKIINGEENAIKNYLNFLSCGSSLHPLEIYNTLGIDLMKEEIYEQAITYFDSQLDLYKQLNEEGE